ncbi:DUF952 domain-containing protein [Montanilutibacter psychrotolerans]|uniref:DUF952 domain-containing protein n=1 Tax=Montanilutibacter psychrotolerans TaxID=1327343 RepID=A0A3M8SR60_9GAMM|nr:DUF952 domain-containing protein [Lysobacter psychrotolerans]RNF83818.1 DUF952 domain-containing protein [Lysobacter psychrotolerans]
MTPTSTELRPVHVFHFAVPAAWEIAQPIGEYAPPLLAEEGFLHCATETQIAGVVARYLRGAGPRVRLEIDAAALGDSLRYEWSEGSGDYYPHVYGPIPLSAVIATEPFEAPADGSDGSRA